MTHQRLAMRPILRLLPLVLLHRAHLTHPASDFPSDHDNFVCSRTYGPGAYPLPCKPARDHWQSAFRHTFAITAWWPPGMH